MRVERWPAGWAGLRAPAPRGAAANPRHWRPAVVRCRRDDCHDHHLRDVADLRTHRLVRDEPSLDLQPRLTTPKRPPPAVADEGCSLCGASSGQRLNHPRMRAMMRRMRLSSCGLVT